MLQSLIFGLIATDILHQARCAWSLVMAAMCAHVAAVAMWQVSGHIIVTTRTTLISARAWYHSLLSEVGKFFDDRSLIA